MCAYCGRRLAAKDLVPVASWLWLHGKCRYCGAKIEDTPLAELLTAALFVASYVFWPLSLHGDGLLQFGCWLVFVVGFVALGLYDARWYILPDRIVFPLIGLAVAELLARLVFFHAGLHAVLGGLWGVLTASGIFYVLFQISAGKWIGGGDVKLGIVLGLLVGGPVRSFLLLFVASLLGTLVSLPLLALGKARRDTLIPYGPFLIAGAVIVVLFGADILSWFNNLVLG
jgi:leader peptidase (prepilin peptidase) / N-methyltransferase